MRLYQALCSVMISAAIGACATQLDESGEPLDLESEASGGGGQAAIAGSGSSVAKGGSAGSMAFGGSAGVSGKGGAGGSSSSGGSAGAGSANSAGAGGDDGGSSGSSGNSGSSGSGAAGAPSTSCSGLPLWTANAEPPNKPMLQGDELTYMGHKFAVEPEGAMIAWWNDVCPPSGTRATWCETDAQRYTDLGPCE